MCIYSYPAELHIIHYAQKYGSVNEAIKHKDGLAVLAVFMELAARDNVAIRRIADRLEPIEHLGTEVELTYSVQLMDLLPSNTDNFYRYKGSLVYKPVKPNM